MGRLRLPTQETSSSRNAGNRKVSVPPRDFYGIANFDGNLCVDEFMHFIVPLPMVIVALIEFHFLCRHRFFPYCLPLCDLARISCLEWPAIIIFMGRHALLRNSGRLDRTVDLDVPPGFETGPLSTLPPSTSLCTFI